MEAKEMEAGGVSSKVLCPISSGRGQPSRLRRTASIARSRSRYRSLGLRRSEMASSALRELRILVVEDEYLIATTLCDGLESLGSVVVGPVPSIEKAIKTIASDPDIDAAIVDINLG